MSAKKTQVFLLISAGVLFVLLFIAPKVASTNNSKITGVGEKSFEKATIDLYVNQATKTLEPSSMKQLEAFKSAGLYDSLVANWNKLKRPDIASYYFEQGVLKNSSTSEGWLKSGNRYYYSVQFTEDKSEVSVLYQCAMRCFSKSLKLNPKNYEAKIMLASCYVEGTESPMDGITLLREVEKADSNNVKLQLAFAFFSVRSGQLDKAIARFNKVLMIDSTNIETYLHLADAFERQGQTLNTIDVLQKYSAKTPDVTAKIEVDKYIQQLKTSINK
jgi:tetratricopeptide (TPR) repeat protein